MHRVDLARRLALKGGLAAGSLFLPLPYAWVWAQSEGTLRLLKVPKIALVLGNSKYKHVPLQNPANDARAIGEVLSATGFQVTVKLDSGRAEMAAAVQAYAQTLAANKGVGLFYYAGHGLQLAWRNYMLPVDAEIDTIADIQKQGVEVNALLEGLTRAANPMNIIILDACRDNPFDSLKGVEQKGLSQMDAPQSTILAYATSPGNVASDGEGTNGLYTEHLLREVKVAAAKVEDVFKRVRLNVRLKSKGAQIPWESTSLEEDFYFVPPRSLAIIADEEVERARKQETALREKRLAAEAAERKSKQEQALREARLAAEQAERKQQQELALLEKKRVEEEAELKRKYEAALKEAQRTAQEAERKRLQEQALREARLAEEEAERKYRQELALREKQRAQEEAERKRREEQVQREARLAEEEAARKRKQELALLEQQRAKEDVERKQKQNAAPIAKPGADAERQFAIELAIWEKARDSKRPEPVEDYLLRYPSGRFSELAQLLLDQELARQGENRIKIASSQGNPFTKGSALADARYKVGDSYTFRVLDPFSKVEQSRFTNTVSQITDKEVTFDRGLVFDLLGNVIRQPDGRVFGPNQVNPLEFAVGRRWVSRFIITSKGNVGESEQEFRIVDREKIVVPAGTFDAFVVLAHGFTTGTRADGRAVETRTKRWFAPEQVRLPVATEELRKTTSGNITIANERRELVAFKQS